MDKVEYWKNNWEIEFKIVNGRLELDNFTVDGCLDLKGCTSLVSLPDNIKVARYLDLEGCTSLKSLPDNLTVDGFIDLNGCTSLKSLPDNLTVGVYLNLTDCTSLKSLPDNLAVGGYLGLNGCTSLKHIGKNNLFERIYFDEYAIILEDSGYNYLTIYQEIPLSLKQSFVGKRLIDLIDDPRIYGTRYAESIITKLDEDNDFVIEFK